MGLAAPPGLAGPWLRCGPLVRYTDRTTAVLWAETATPDAVQVRVMDAATSRVWWLRAHPVEVGRSYYFWLPLEFLTPGSWYYYWLYARNRGEVIKLWPDPKLSGTMLPSAIRTFPVWPWEDSRVMFGSCRAGFAPGDPQAPQVGPDALLALASDLMMKWNDRDTEWPHALLHMGDQIYADYPSAALRQKFGRGAATTWSEFADVYREAWTATPFVRWLLSCIPSFMIFDDHEIIDDWNITRQWVANHSSPHWKSRITEGLMAYWVYQGAGNLAPSRWSRDERMRALGADIGGFGDRITTLEPLFRNYATGGRRASWSYAVDLAGTRIVMADTRMSRRLKPKRLLMDDEAWSEVKQLASRPSRRLLFVTPGPILVADHMHDLFSWVSHKIDTDDPSWKEQALAALSVLFAALALDPLVPGASAAAAPMAGLAALKAEDIIDAFIPDLVEEFDVELWPAFSTSFDRLLDLLKDLSGHKDFIGLLSGDVHYSSVIRGDLLGPGLRTSVLQIVSSALRRSMTDDDWTKLSNINSGDAPFLTKEQGTEVITWAGTPGFVNDQRDRLDWYPLDSRGRPWGWRQVDDWAYRQATIASLSFASQRVTWKLYQPREPTEIVEVRGQKLGSRESIGLSEYATDTFLSRRGVWD